MNFEDPPNISLKASKVSITQEQSECKIKYFQSVATSECSILLEKLSLSLHKANKKGFK